MGGFSIVLLTGMLPVIFFFYVALLVSVFLYSLISYTFESIALMRMSTGAKAAAWIPFYNKYLLGKTAGKSVLGTLSGILTLAQISLSLYFYLWQKFEPYLFALLLLCTVLNFVFNAVMANRIFSDRTGKYSDILTAVNIITLGLLQSVFIFAVRNKSAKEPQLYQRLPE